jgi:hypothetical protein
MPLGLNIIDKADRYEAQVFGGAVLISTHTFTEPSDSSWKFPQNFFDFNVPCDELMTYLVVITAYDRRWDFQNGTHYVPFGTRVATYLTNELILIPPTPKLVSQCGSSTFNVNILNPNNYDQLHLTPDLLAVPIIIDKNSDNTFNYVGVHDYAKVFFMEYALKPNSECPSVVPKKSAPVPLTLINIPAILPSLPSPTLFLKQPVVDTDGCTEPLSFAQLGSVPAIFIQALKTAIDGANLNPLIDISEPVFKTTWSTETPDASIHTGYKDPNDPTNLNLGYRVCYQDLPNRRGSCAFYTMDLDIEMNITSSLYHPNENDPANPIKVHYSTENVKCSQKKVSSAEVCKTVEPPAPQVKMVCANQLSCLTVPLNGYSNVNWYKGSPDFLTPVGSVNNGGYSELCKVFENDGVEEYIITYEGDNGYESVTSVYKVLILPESKVKPKDAIYLVQPPPIGNNGPITECDIPNTYHDLGVQTSDYTEALRVYFQDVNDNVPFLELNNIEFDLNWRPQEFITKHKPFDNPGVTVERVCFYDLPPGDNTERKYYLSVDIEADVSVTNPYNGTVVNSTITNDCDVDVIIQPIRKAPPLPVSPDACAPILTNVTTLFDLIDCEAVRTHIVCENDPFVLGNPVDPDDVNPTVLRYEWYPKNSGLSDYSAANPVGTWAGMPISEDGGMVYKVDISKEGAAPNDLTRQCDFVWKCSSCGLGNTNSKQSQTSLDHDHSTSTFEALNFDNITSLNTHLEVFSILGEKLFEGSSENFKSKFNVKNNEIYIMRYLDQNNQTVIRKILKP